MKMRKERVATGTRIGRIGYDQEGNDEFVDNSIRTSKYTFYNFIILNLYNQFRRIANVYFLFQGILMFIGDSYPQLYQSPVNPWSTIGTLVFVLTVTLIKDGVEDLYRHQADNKENNRLITVVRDGSHVEIPSCTARVGDWVKVHNREQFPAYLVAVISADEAGQLFVETANIDGETNLKIRRTVKNFIHGVVTDPLQLPNGGTFECDLPNKHIHTFNCTLTMDGKRIPVSAENFLLRGSVLRNTTYIYGLVVYTGLDTKVMKNMTKAPSKLSSVERTTNRLIFLIFFTHLILVIISVMISISIREDFDVMDFYYLRDSTGGIDDTVFPFWLAQFLSFYILYGQMVPISLYVTMELVNVAQGFFVNNDALMVYTEESSGKNSSEENLVILPECKDSTLCQEIGQVQYIFSDKTGTLTRNVMEFKSCSVGGVVYKTFDQLMKANLVDVEESGTYYSSRPLSKFLELLSICHTVIPDYLDPETGHESDLLRHDNINKFLNYEAESPDEGALVDAAAVAGYAYIHKTPTTVTVLDAHGQRHTYELLAENAFTSTRKRMSVLMRDENGKVRLFCKGADNVMLELSSDNEMVKNDIDLHLTQFAEKGLRTLVCAVRELTQDEYKDWLKVYEEAQLNVDDRDNALSIAADMIERNMKIVGATAVEDKLQEGVPETIAHLAEAGIKLWVLTGDKMETAINIGYACRLLTKDMKVIKLKCRSAAQTRMKLDHLSERLQAPTSPRFRSTMANKFNLLRIRRSKKSQHIGSPVNDFSILPKDHPEINASDDEVDLDDQTYFTNSLAIVIDGNTLRFVMEDIALRNLFVTIGDLCKSVIACRVSPAQKAEVVRLFKNKVSLAIGDGANDVSMIQAAKIGVGIKGKEGRQAVNAADFAIGQFRFLKRLLIVHGRWNYRRMSKVILVSFYKNAALVFTLFIYNFFALNSGVSLYDSFVYAGFNFFTGMPVLLLGVFDRDLSEEAALALPIFYALGQKNVHLNAQRMTEWIFRAVVTSVVVTVILVVAFIKDLGAPTYSSMGSSDSISDLQSYGTLIFTTLFFAVMYTIALETFTWNGWYTFFFCGSYLFYMSCITALSSVPPIYIVYYGVVKHVLSSSYFWLHTIFIATIDYMANLFFKNARLQFCSNDLDVAVEIDRRYWKTIPKAERENMSEEQIIRMLAAAVEQVKAGRGDASGWFRRRTDGENQKDAEKKPEERNFAGGSTVAEGNLDQEIHILTEVLDERSNEVIQAFEEELEEVTLDQLRQLENDEYHISNTDQTRQRILHEQERMLEILHRHSTWFTKAFQAGSVQTSATQSKSNKLAKSPLTPAELTIVDKWVQESEYGSLDGSSSMWLTAIQAPTAH